MNKRIAQEAINQYNEVKSVIEENKGKTIEELYEICSEKFHRNVSTSMENYLTSNSIE